MKTAKLKGTIDSLTGKITWRPSDETFYGCRECKKWFKLENYDLKNYKCRKCAGEE